jgi:glycosyltransferase involved in cell wall biosynthesis
VKTAVFTIISNNYTAQARTLLQSLARHEPTWERFVVLVDRPLEKPLIPIQEAQVLEAADLPLTDPDDFFIRYNILEANTAVKPWAFSALFEKGYGAVVYYDPDIQLFSPQVELAEMLLRNDGVLTPHLTQGYSDRSLPGDLEIKRAGVYNLGFLALRDTPSSHSLLTWWKKHLAHDCRVALDRGIFVDQSWMNFAPCLLENCGVLRHPGYNMAYWNLHYRQLSEDGIPSEPPRLQTGEALRFFHYSGFDWRKPSILSIHQNRFLSRNFPGWLTRFLEDYAGVLKSNGAEEACRIPYRLGPAFVEGHSLPPYLKEWIGQQPMFRGLFSGGKVVEGVYRELQEYFLLPDSKYPQLPLFLGRLVELRPDLKRHFQLQTGLFGWKVTGWLRESGAKEVGLPPDWPLEGWWNRLPTWRKKMETRWLRRLQKLGGNTKSWGHHLSFFVGHFILPIPRYPHTVRKLEIDEKPQFNVYGYFNAETGVGEIARGTLQTLRSLGYSARAVNFENDLRSVRGQYGLTFGLPDPRAHVDFLHVNADQMRPLLYHHPELNACRKHRVAYWAWELEEPPEDLASAARLVDEIWCLSTFNADCFRRRASCPVYVAPPGVNLEVPLVTDSDPVMGLDGSCLFLSFADFLSYPERKNPLKALLAYLQAFPEESADCRLFLKLAHTEHNPDYFELLRQTAGMRRDIILWTEPMTRAQVNRLLEQCTAYVSLHSAEGFGLPIAEALARGKWVVATAYGGNLQFCTPHNSYLVPYERTAIPYNLGPYRAGQIWADPNHHQASLRLKKIHDVWKAGRRGQTPVDINGASLEAYRKNLKNLARRLER